MENLTKFLFENRTIISLFWEDLGDSIFPNHTTIAMLVTTDETGSKEPKTMVSVIGVVEEWGSQWGNGPCQDFYYHLCGSLAG
jgi:hypothetical protein